MRRPQAATEVVETDVIHVDKSAPEEHAEGPQEEVGVEARAFVDEEGPSVHHSESSCQEPDPKHHYQPAHHLDVRGSVLSSRLTQARAVEQFWLPRDEEFLKGVPNASLHQSLQSYLIRGSLMEQEIFGSME
ncbi:uncharacterized protein A4U43_C06F11570 [Asparagus officinalis]|uniref:Uncharacterized protein n=1 Tax=Asparagus officinalis TaxID=4686 RepID=A0A5P1EQB9_ASPOF|nr:uncharacterized protein A4U43_C06F11570 [Asparagus officinalis]